MRAIFLFVTVLLLALAVVMAQDQSSTQSEDALGISCQLGDPSCNTVSDTQQVASSWDQPVLPDSATSSAPNVPSESVWQQEPTIWADATTSETEQYASPLSAAPEAASETTVAESTTTQEQTSATSISYRFTLGYDTDTSTISTSAAFKSSANIPVLAAIFAIIVLAFHTTI